MADALVNYPGEGSFWVYDIELHRCVFIEGWVDDASVPEGKSWSNWPIQCVRQLGESDIDYVVHPKKSFFVPKYAIEI